MCLDNQGFTVEEEQRTTHLPFSLCLYGACNECELRFLWLGWPLGGGGLDDRWTGLRQGGGVCTSGDSVSGGGGVLLLIM